MRDEDNRRLNLILHFGVVETPYNSTSYQKAPKASKFRKGAPKPIKRDRAVGSNVNSTGDVAVILEEKYHIFETFAEVLGFDVIASSLEHSLDDAIKDIQAGAPEKGLSVTLAAEQELETAFRIFIDQQEMDGTGTAGLPVPTKAALRGVNHRFLHPYAKGNPARPSFRDTGLYEASFKAWMTT
jgi:hypothetical protein